ncbi:hypothetical protein NP493_1883g00000 [Ridgeia piscesae]|uniref:Uncharacterized protein n=1 Tax=Ridgeia piscesae TaxID=27915 RepID=A0AAD9JRQ5_RIDPI|nr:hypothetical protein NP493_1883g00000 [Ridgeia piscesae]
MIVVPSGVNIVGSRRRVSGDAQTAYGSGVYESRYYRRQETIVNPFPYVLVTSPRTACPDGIVLVIVVHSHPSYYDRRDAISSFVRCENETHRYIFLNERLSEHFIVFL